MAGGRIPENLLDDILSRVDIAELIAGYIPLKRAGRNFKANCPFHHEKTPSFMVSPERQIYHCFGCGAGGNAFRFLMQYERLEFMEAVQALAKKSGVSLPKSQPQDAGTVSLTTQLYKINELTAQFYENIFISAAGSAAQDYLKKRGISAATLKLFKIGFAPDRWDALISHLRAKNIGLSSLEKAGLVLSKEGGGYYDRFRNRVIFPILDIKSRPIAFGGRLLPSGPGGKEEDLAKYVNSPETPIYTKGRNLFGLDLSREAIREKDFAVVVEGYLDLITPYQGGLKNIVASLGTALTYEQARLLKRHTHNVVMLYDGDSAGELATLRSLDIFIEEGMNVKVVSLPKGFDPDSFVCEKGIDKLQEIVEEADNLFDYKLSVLKQRYGLKDIEAKAKIVSEMLVSISKFQNAVLKSEYIKKLAQALDVQEEALFQELGKIKQDKVYAPVSGTEPPKALNINPTEKLLIKMMLEEVETIKRIRESLEPADFQDDRISRLVSVMFDLTAQGKKIETSNLINHLEDNDMLRVICESTFSPEVSEQNREEIIDDCIHRLKNQRLKLKRQYLHDQIKSAQREGDEEKLHKLIRDFDNLIKTKT